MATDTEQEKEDLEPERMESLHSRWSGRIKEAGNQQKQDWEDKADQVVRRYRDDRGDNPYAAKQFNLLWSNVETLKPALFSNSPKPQVSRRYKDQDPVGRIASELLERGLEYTTETYDFDGLVRRCIEDYLLPGRALPKIGYKPFFGEPETLEGGDVYEPLEYEEVTCSYIFWKDVRMGQARTWELVPWLAYRSYLTKKEVK
ncbi:MAG: hypothetical protein MI867_21765, partial [Pseudomonadales bacterium]|nr:hypothetical protein [Pseudomonadales bacterium]